MDEETAFKEFFRSIIENYELSPEIAAALLQKILEFLKSNCEESDYP